MKKRDIRNYCQLAFINGVNDAISVLMLHKVFVVLMTGNLIYSITDLATTFIFADLVRITLIINFILSGIVVHNIIAKKDIQFRIRLSLLFIVIYFGAGTYASNSHSLGDSSWGFLIVANLATTMSVVMNNIFYRLHVTKFNLVAYTMNLLNLAHMIAEKRHSELRLLGVTFASFISGIAVASLLVIYLKFYTVLIIIPILISLYIANLNVLPE